jgi:hypothetical protein
MKTYIKINILWMLFALLFAAGLQAQVSIGSLTPAEPFALLQIKNHNANTPGGATVDNKGGGLLLPRVALNNTSDVTFIQKASIDQNLILTGMMVYNVNTSGALEEGIYEWDGSNWNLLEVESKNSGSKTTTEIKNTSTPISMGNFTFGMDAVTKNPQCKLTQQPNADVTFYYNIAGYWQMIIQEKKVTDAGYNYDNKSITFTTSNWDTWQDLITTGGDDKRYEIWFADSITNQVYNVQFINVTNLTNPLYMILITEY